MLTNPIDILLLRLNCFLVQAGVPAERLYAVAQISAHASGF
jgi:hypothetical protein